MIIVSVFLVLFVVTFQSPHCFYCLLPLKFTHRVFVTDIAGQLSPSTLVPASSHLYDWNMQNCISPACPQGDSLKTSIQLDFGDGIKITYSNLSRTDDGIRHIYRATGIYRVTASAENEQGSDSSTLFLHITSTAPPLLIPAAATIAWTSWIHSHNLVVLNEIRGLCLFSAVQTTKHTRALNVHRLWSVILLKGVHVNICVLPQVRWSACISLLRW